MEAKPAIRVIPVIGPRASRPCSPANVANAASYSPSALQMPNRPHAATRLGWRFHYRHESATTPVARTMLEATSTRFCRSCGDGRSRTRTSDARQFLSNTSGAIRASPFGPGSRLRGSRRCASSPFGHRSLTQKAAGALRRHRKPRRPRVRVRTGLAVTG